MLVLYFCVLIVFLLRRESLKLILVDKPLPEVVLSQARGIISMEPTVGSKSLATAFFIVGVQGNYSVILGYDWIHVNHCIPSTLHQFLIQWIDDEIEVVYVDTSAYISLADVTAIGSMRVPSAYRGRIVLATIFLRSTMMYFCSFCAANFQNSAQRCSF
jgi:hypothetical protein